jgi:hypothetical protein
MNEQMIREQSKAAYAQWAPQWRDHAAQNAVFFMKSLEDLQNTGVGKAVLCVANGYSFEENIETIKKHQHNVDIMACDKTLGHLIDNGIKPKYLIMCDANVDYERYMAKWKDQLQDTILLANVCGNPLWAKNGNWKDKYFFINKDILQSELEFSQISGCKNFIPAGTNVSNAMVVMLTQSDNGGRQNFFGYDKILLIGYDYSWRHGGKYYSFNKDGDNKASYMRHIYTNTTDGDFAYTSGNLHFSAQWFLTYVKAFNLPVVQCSGKSILHGLKVSNLDEQMTYRFKPEDSTKVKSALVERTRLLKELKKQESIIQTISQAHWQSFLCSV